MDRKILASVLVFSLLVLGCVAQGGGSSTSNGRMVVAMTDAAANMGAVSSVKVTVDSVKVHSATQGWVTASSNARTYDLLQLKSEGSTALLTDSNLKADTYDQMDLAISQVTVVDAQGSHEAKLPSNSFKITSNVVVNENQTSTATFDFIADESLHVTGNGKYIMAPVAKVETRENAEVSADSNNRVSIVGGTVKSNAQVGMDINGNVGVGIKIPADAVLDVGANGVISIGAIGAAGKGNVLVGITDAAANMGAVTSVKVTVDSVKAHSSTQGWVDLSTTSQTYDLLKLKAEGSTAVLANATVDAGAYDQLRLDISKVVVTDAQGDHEAKLPSGELKVMGQMKANAEATSTATFDFIADESLHVTGNGKYVMTPVIQLETRENATVQAEANNRIRVSDGVVRTNIKLGMDADGNVGEGIRVPIDAEISIGENDDIVIGIGGGMKGAGEITMADIYKYGAVTNYEYRVVSNVGGTTTTSTVKASFSSDTVNGKGAWVQSSTVEAAGTSAVTKTWISKADYTCLKLTNTVTAYGQTIETAASCPTTPGTGTASASGSAKITLVGTESVTVPAGTFRAKHYTTGSGDAKTDYWTAEEVPIPVKVTAGTVTTMELVSYS